MPGTDVREDDRSQVVESKKGTIAGMMAVAERGPVDEPTLITSWPQFERIFGSFIDDSFGAYCAQQYLEAGGILYFSRVTAHDGSWNSLAVAAEVTLQTTGGGTSKASTTGTVAGVLVGSGDRTWAFASGNKLFALVNGAAAAGITLTANAAIKALSDAATHNVTDGDWFEYKVGTTGNNGPKRRVTFAGVTGGAATIAELVANLAAQMVGVKVSYAANVITLTTDKRGSTVRFEFTGDSNAGAILAALGLAVEVVVPAGGSNVGDIDFTTFTELAALFEAAVPGIDLSLASDGKVKAERVLAGAANTFEFDDGDADKAAGLAVLGLDAAEHAGANAQPIDTLVVKAKTPGTWANGADGGLKVTTGDAPNNAADRFFLKVYLGDLGEFVVNEDDLSLDPADDRYVAKVFEGNEWIEVEDLDAHDTTDDYADARPAPAADTSLAGGADGLSGLSDSDFIGDQTKKKGLYAWDPVLDVRLLGAPGWTTRTWAEALLAYCEDRRDVFAILDAPQALEAAGLKDYRMATGSYVGDGSKFISTYGAGYAPWIGIRDVKARVERFVPPMGHVMAVYAVTDREAGTHYAPAGPQRGRLRKVTRLFKRFGKADETIIYGAGWNPIVEDPDFGFLIHGQKTLAGVASKRDRVNVRRLLITMRVELIPIVKFLAEFEPNDPTTWLTLGLVVEPYLGRKERERALNAGTSQFICDETTNPPDLIDQHKLTAKLVINPTVTAEDIELVLTIAPTGVTLEQLEQ